MENMTCHQCHETYSYEYEEVDNAKHYVGFGDYEYDDPGLEFENTVCAKCGEHIGPGLGEDDNGYPREHWTLCFRGPLGLLCEECTEEVEPSHTCKKEATDE